MKKLVILLILSGTVVSLSSQSVDSMLLVQLNTFSEKDSILIIPDFSFFKFSLMTDEQEETLETILAYLNTTGASFEVFIHSDCRGDREYNDAVTERKAEIMQRWYTRRGIEKDKLLIRGAGENFPLIDCGDCTSCTEVEHDQNSRIELIYKK